MRPALYGAAGLAAAGVAAVAHPLWQGFDDRWHTFVTGPREGPQWGLAMVLDFIGGPKGLTVTLAIVLLLVVLKRWRSALFFFTGGLAAAVVAQLFKHAVDRPRPGGALVVVDHGSFPSGHVVTAAATIVLLGVIVPAAWRKAWLGFGVVYVVLVIWSRTYVYAHWLSDAIAGALIGAGVALLWWALFQRLLRKENHVH